MILRQVASDCPILRSQRRCAGASPYAESTRPPPPRRLKFASAAERWPPRRRHGPGLAAGSAAAKLGLSGYPGLNCHGWHCVRVEWAPSGRLRPNPRARANMAAWRPEPHWRRGAVATRSAWRVRPPGLRDRDGAADGPDEREAPCRASFPTWGTRSSRFPAGRRGSVRN